MQYKKQPNSKELHVPTKITLHNYTVLYNNDFKQHVLYANINFYK